MKKLIVFICFLSCFTLFSQDVKHNDRKKILVVYEENNKNIDPWIKLFKEEIIKSGNLFDDKSALETNKMDLSSYDIIIIFGSVMAFTSKEPIRDWLKATDNISGKKVALFVTANRWFLKKYFDQLLTMLKNKNVEPIDAVSTATKNINSNDKKIIVQKFINRLIIE